MAPTAPGDVSCSPTWAQPSADGATVFVACNKSSDIVEIDVKTWTLTRRIPAGDGVYNLAVTHDGRCIIGTNKRGQSVSVIDIASGKELARIPTTRKAASGVAVSSDDKYAFVTVEGVGAQPGTVDIIDLAYARRRSRRSTSGRRPAASTSGRPFRDRRSTTMRAAVITRFGGPEVLEVQDRPTPEPSDGEILVRVRASALNRADLHQREGNYPAPPGAPSDIPGLEFAGEVVGVGTGATEWTVGDRVFGIVPGGGNAEFLVTDARSVAHIPSTLSWTDAAAIPEAFITAHDALVVQAGLRVGERVLIHAVGSGVGLAATQIATRVGCVAVWHRAHGGQDRTRARVWSRGRRRRGRGHGGDDGGGRAVGEPESGMDVTLDLLGGPYLGREHSRRPRSRGASCSSARSQAEARPCRSG